MLGYKNLLNRFPTMRDVANHAGLCIDHVKNHHVLKKHPKHRVTLEQAEIELGYVNCLYNLKYQKPLQAMALIGNWDEYISALSLDCEMPILFDRNAPQDPIDAFQRFGVANVIAFQIPIEYDQWYWIDRNMIFVDCEPQNVFTSVEGFDPKLTAHFIRWLCRMPRLSPINIRNPDAT